MANGKVACRLFLYVLYALHLDTNYQNIFYTQIIVCIFKFLHNADFFRQTRLFAQNLKEICW